MHLSSVIKKLKPSATLAINELISEKRRKGEHVFHMGFGESPFPVHHLIRKALSDNVEQKSYLPTQGILPLREQISKFYSKMFDLHYSPDQIVVGPGSKLLLFDALMALEGPLFLSAPSWVSYEQEAHLLDKEVYYIKTRPEDSYKLTPEALVTAIQEFTPSHQQQKLLILNYPCNPTGHSYSAAQLKSLAIAARKHNITIIADEIYALLSYQEHEHHSIAEYYPEGTLVTGGLSKDRSAGGFRVGVMLLPEGETKLKSAILAIASNTWSCVAAPIQYAALEAYRLKPEIVQYINDCTAIHELVTMNIYRSITKNRIFCPSPQGAFYLFPNWNNDREALVGKGIATSTELVEMLLREWNIASLPGADFGMSPSDLSIRIAIVDYDGVNALKQFRADKRKALEESDLFVNEIAPQVVAACSRLGSFTESIR
ncbi:MAG: pyridoxal phosphate-dependent aminotransferase [Candidatus Thorarchaeota archaeon]